MPLVSYAKKLFQKIDTAFSFDLLVTIFVVALLVYGKSLFNGFVGDDYAQIISNEAIKQGDAIFSIFAKGTFATGGAGGGLGGIYYKPLMTFLFALIYSTVGLNPFAFHALSLLTHIANIILLFFVSRNFFKVAKFHYAQASAFLLSFIFLIHPGNSETVLYIADMQDLLVAFFLLLSLLFLQSLKKPLLSLKKCLILGILLLGGMFGKESGIVALVLIPVYAFLFLRPIWKRVLAVSIAVFFVYVLFRFQIAHIPLFQTLGFIPIHAATPWQRFLTMPFELFSYFRLIFFPADLFLYQHDVVLSLLEWKFYLLLPVDIIVGGFLLWFALIMRSKLYTFFLIWMILGFGIVMNLIPLDMTLEERWLYLPFIGFLCAFFLIINGILAKWSSYMRLCIVVGLCFLIPLYVGRSFVRSLNFQNNVSLYSHDISRNPYSYELLNNYGVALLEAGRLQESEGALKASIHYSPRYWPAYSNLGLVYERMHQYDKAKQYYWLAIGMSQYFTTYEDLAQLTLQTEPSAYVVPILQQALALYPYNPKLLTIAAKTYDKLGKEDLARVYAQKAVELDSGVLQDPVIQRLTGN